MKKVITFFCLSVICPVFIFAQMGKLNGVIRDSSGKSIECANILIQQITTGTASDAQGNYMIENIPVGNCTVWVSSMGYNQASAKIEIKPDETSIANFTLIPRGH